MTAAEGEGDDTAGDRPRPRRVAARVIMVDPDDAVLLMSGRDPSIENAPVFWFTPGGGAGPGEPLEAAARREVYEEVGHALGELGPVVWERSTSFVFDGIGFDQDESFFVVRTPRFEARRVAWTDIEERSTIGWRWWPVSELAASDAEVYPSSLGALVEEWVRIGPPASPRRID
jgi:8-oxo-dGTP pyrophosphatase MutT (NUDIX family)